jgi:hypothetical protein
MSASIRAAEGGASEAATGLAPPSSSTLYSNASYHLDGAAVPPTAVTRPAFTRSKVIVNVEWVDFLVLKLKGGLFDAKREFLAMHPLLGNGLAALATASRATSALIGAAGGARYSALADAIVPLARPGAPGEILLTFAFPPTNSADAIGLGAQSKEPATSTGAGVLLPHVETFAITIDIDDSDNLPPNMSTSADPSERKAAAVLLAMRKLQAAIALSQKNRVQYRATAP